MYVIVVFALILLAVQIIQESGIKTASYDEFLRLLDLGYVQWVIVGEDEHVGRAVIPEDAPPFNLPATDTSPPKDELPKDSIHERREIGGKLPDHGDLKFRVTAAVRDEKLLERLKDAQDRHQTKYQIRTRSG